MRPAPFIVVVFSLLLASCFSGCKPSGPREAPVTGRRTDAPVSMPATWQEGRRYIFRVDSSTDTEVPRKNTTQLIRSQTAIGQELAFTVTNVAPDGSRLLQMELLSVQFETGRDDDVTLSYDSLNPVLQVEDTPIIQRLRKLIGLKLAFRLSPSNTVTRVDGARDLNDRLSSGSSVRGVAAQVLARCVNQQFYRDLVEMNFLPRNPVRIGETWNFSRPTNLSPRGGSGLAHFTYTFEGWQQRQGTNCARLEFVADFNSPPAPASTAPAGTNAPGTNSTAPPRRPPPQKAAIEDGSITGTSWYSPDLTLAIETTFSQSVTTKTAIGRRTRTTITTNAPAPGTGDTNANNIVEIVETDAPAAAPAAVDPAAGNASAPVTTINTTTRQATTIKLVEIEQLKAQE